PEHQARERLEHLGAAHAGVGGRAHRRDASGHGCGRASGRTRPGRRAPSRAAGVWREIGTEGREEEPKRRAGRPPRAVEHGSSKTEGSLRYVRGVEPTPSPTTDAPTPPATARAPRRDAVRNRALLIATP